jgi:hypothetical protein
VSLRSAVLSYRKPASAQGHNKNSLINCIRIIAIQKREKWFNRIN